MTLVDYPGHFGAVVIVLLFAGITFIGFRSGELRRPEREVYRWILMALQYAVVLLLLLILWNPSRWHTAKVYERNAVLTVFDTSESMSIADDQQSTRLDKALDSFARHFRPHNAAGPEYKVYGFDRHTYHCGSSDLLRRWGAETDLHPVCSLLARYEQSGEPGPVVRKAAAEREGAPGPDAEAHIERETPAGAVIFTDGQVRVKNPRAYPLLPKDDRPVLFVGVGSRKPLADLAVTSVSAPARVWMDTVYGVTVTVTGTKPPTDPVTVELLCDDGLVEARQIEGRLFEPSERGAASADLKAPEVKVEFTVPAQQLGAHVLTARARPHKEEVNLANNARDTCVEVTQERTLNVLLYSQWANFDIGKIRQALAWDKRIHLDLGFDVVKDAALSESVSQGAGYVKLPRTKEQFYEYDVIILGPCDLSRFTPAQLDALYGFVAERGGGLMLLPGPAVTSLAAWRDERGNALLPVVFDEREPRLWPPRPDTIHITFEGAVSRIFGPAAFEDQDQPLSPYYDVALVKPAATTLATVRDIPLVSAHRVGRGRVCLLNAAKLFMLYREDRQGGLLNELISGLVVDLGRTPSRGAGVELFVERSAEDPRRVAFSAYVLDKGFRPVREANVLLTVRDHVVSMKPVGQGCYTAEIDQGLSPSVVATVQAESNGFFLGERTTATSLPPVHDEMSNVALDEGLLRALAQRLGGTYVHIDDVDDRVAKGFVPKRQIGTTQTVGPAWPTWPLLLALCLLLSVNWFLRRAIGLV